MTIELVELVLAGIGAGVLAGMFGVGGGILFVPALVLVADLGQLEATATSLAAMIPAVAVGAWFQHRNGNVRWRAAILIGLFSAAGVAVGALLTRWLPEDALRGLFAGLLVVTAVHLVWSEFRGRKRDGSEERG
jgi:hypothetical protein